MNATFPMQTGAISYKIDVEAPAATGSWSVSLGFLDIKPNAWNISGVGGMLYDNSGYMVGSYNSTTLTSLEGVIRGNSHTIYQDGVLLSNTETQDPSDYNQVSISGDYVGGYLPLVGIGGKRVYNETSNLTVPFWRKVGDDRLLFVTENAQADLGFIQAVSGMGFIVDTGVRTGAAGTQGVDVGSPYGLIVFGSATSSGLYHSGVWNALNIPMMSLNSHLVSPENLNWYSDIRSSSSGNETGAVFPGRYFTEGGVNDFWAEFPIKGWERLVRSPYRGKGDVSYYVPYGQFYSGVEAYYYPAPNEYAEWNYADSPTNTEIQASAANGILHSGGLGSYTWVTYTDGGYQKIDGYVSGTAKEPSTCWKTGDLVTITWPVDCGCPPWTDGISAEIYEISRGDVGVDPNDSFFYRFSTSHGVPSTDYDITVEPSESCLCDIWATGDLMTVEFGDGSRIDGQVAYKDPFDGPNCTLNFSLNEAGVATEGTGISVYTRPPPKYASFESSGSHTIVRLVNNVSEVELYGSGIFAGEVDPTEFSNGLQSDLEIEFTGIDGAPAIVTTVLSNTLGGTGASTATWGTAWGLDQTYNKGRVVPQTASYNVNNLYRRTTLTSGLYPADKFNMYTGGVSTTDGFGGDIFVANTDSGKLITVWHKGFWTGGYSGAPDVGGFTQNELMSFSVTPTGNDWATGYNMWDTLTVTGKQLFVNAVAGFFID